MNHAQVMHISLICRDTLFVSCLCAISYFLITFLCYKYMRCQSLVKSISGYKLDLSCFLLTYKENVHKQPCHFSFQVQIQHHTFCLVHNMHFESEDSLLNVGAFSAHIFLQGFLLFSILTCGRTCQKYGGATQSIFYVLIFSFTVLMSVPLSFIPGEPSYSQTCHLWIHQIVLSIALFQSIITILSVFKISQWSFFSSTYYCLISACFISVFLLTPPHP